MNVGIVGLGLIGGSFAKALRQVSHVRTYGTDIWKANVQKALSNGDIWQELTEETLGLCDLTIIALHPSDTIEYLKTAALLFKKESLVVDCCEIKEAICDTAFPLAREHHFTFVGGDPFVESHDAGYEASSAILFKNREFVLTPCPDESKAVLNELSSLLKSLGFSNVKFMSPAEHDHYRSNAADLADSLISGKAKKKQMDDNVIAISASKNYDMIVQQGLLERTGELLSKLFPSGKAAIITDDVVASLYAPKAEASLRASGFEVYRYVFPHGENSKNFSTLISILEHLAGHQFTRSDLLIALGGGVTGDMVGFAAHIYLRGIPFVQIPTTFLAAIDSSVGGKTAVNLKAGKNLAGAFNQPNLVICDYSTLFTLSDEEFACGAAEAIKHGILTDKELFQAMNAPDAREHLEWIIKRSILIKRNYVMADEYDTGSRQFLNLGHTLAHAIEKQSQYTISHGHAVAIGLVAVARAAYRYGLTKVDSSEEIRTALQRYHLKTDCPYPVHDLCKIILNDKKRTGNTITLVIPMQIGECILYKLPVDELENFFSRGV